MSAGTARSGWLPGELARRRHERNLGVRVSSNTYEDLGSSRAPGGVGVDAIEAPERLLP
jgi:hypothetical protein